MPVKPFWVIVIIYLLAATQPAIVRGQEVDIGQALRMIAGRSHYNCVCPTCTTKADYKSAALPNDIETLCEAACQNITACSVQVVKIPGEGNFKIAVLTGLPPEVAIALGRATAQIDLLAFAANEIDLTDRGALGKLESYREDQIELLRIKAEQFRMSLDEIHGAGLLAKPDYQAGLELYHEMLFEYGWWLDVYRAKVLAFKDTRPLAIN